MCSQIEHQFPHIIIRLWRIYDISIYDIIWYTYDIYSQYFTKYVDINREQFISQPWANSAYPSSPFWFAFFFSIFIQSWIRVINMIYASFVWLYCSVVMLRPVKQITEKLYVVFLHVQLLCSFAVPISPLGN